DDPDAFAMQRLDGLRRALLDRIGHAEQARGPTVDRDEHRRLALLAQRLGALDEHRDIDAASLEQCPIADQHFLSGHTPGNALASERCKVLCGGELEPT